VGRCVVKNFKPAAFYAEIKEELQKVSWPTKSQTIGTTIVVAVVVLMITAYLGVVDAALARIIATVIG
jgi:preprotein translocase subunit SecE